MGHYNCNIFQFFLVSALRPGFKNNLRLVKTCKSFPVHNQLRLGTRNGQIYYLGII